MSETLVLLITREPFACNVSLELFEVPTSTPPNAQEIVGASIPVAEQCRIACCPVLATTLDCDWITGRATKLEMKNNLNYIHSSITSHSQLITEFDTFLVCQMVSYIPHGCMYVILH